MSEQIANRKQALRETIWRRMAEERIASFPLPSQGRIPNFTGSRAAASRLRTLAEYRAATCVFVNPDAAQLPVREFALRDGKQLVMATPKLRHGFVLISPDAVRGREREAASIRGAFTYGRPITTIPAVDLMVEGCVAVDLQGNRLGKGGGYGDREIRLVKQQCGDVRVVTTCHPIQVVAAVPVGGNDERIDIIVTPARIYYLRA
jgi:5-formyltetrahydrofolate cyclo-ligase